jgi:hypothetical protein
VVHPAHRLPLARAGGWRERRVRSWGRELLHEATALGVSTFRDGLTRRREDAKRRSDELLRKPQPTCIHPTEKMHGPSRVARTPSPSEERAFPAARLMRDDLTRRREGRREERRGGFIGRRQMATLGEDKWRPRAMATTDSLLPLGEKVPKADEGIHEGFLPRCFPSRPSREG